MSDTIISRADKICVLIPLFNDWEALGLLLSKINHTVEPSVRDRLSFLIVDDCSSSDFTHLPTDTGQSLAVLRLFRNLGHQKAIAIGLSYLADQSELCTTIVMDSDGEDQPEDIARLLHASATHPDKIIFAHRAKRRESRVFKIFYAIYKTIFKLLTSKAITFGNFSLVPANQLRKLTRVSEIWNNYPGGVIRSRLPYTAIPIERGIRLAGESKMNFVSLILHGMSAISVLMDTTAVRIFLFCVVTAFGSLFIIGLLFLLRLTNGWLLPEWVNYIILFLSVVILQAFMISLLLVFIVLSSRTQQHFIPAKHYRDFVERVDNVF